MVWFPHDNSKRLYRWGCDNCSDGYCDLLHHSMSLGEVSPCMKAFAAGKAAAYSMFETMNIKPDIDSSDTGGRKLDDICGDIRDVYFRYPTRPHEQILAGLSLAIPSGMTVALVGESGSDQSNRKIL